MAAWSQKGAVCRGFARSVTCRVSAGCGPCGGSLLSGRKQVHLVFKGGGRLGRSSVVMASVEAASSCGAG
jgi:hypothetical protein